MRTSNNSAKDLANRTMYTEFRFMGKLSEVNTEEVEPLIFMSTEVNVLREDFPVISISQKDALKNAPKHDSDYFRIPKVLDKK